MSDIEFYSWPGVGDLPTMSPFCLKVILAAKAKGLGFTNHIVRGQPKWVSTGKLPAAKIDGKPVMDSTHIMHALDALASDKPALYPTDAALKADVVLMEDWADESLVWYLIHYRWNIDANFDEFSRIAFGSLPLPLRLLIPRMIRKQALAKLKGQGLGVLPADMLDANFRELCHALDQKLAGRSYFVGSHLTAADIAVYAPLKEIAYTQLPPAYSIIAEMPNLAAFMGRMDQLLIG